MLPSYMWNKIECLTEEAVQVHKGYPIGPGEANKSGEYKEGNSFCQKL